MLQLNWSYSIRFKLPKQIYGNDFGPIGDRISMNEGVNICITIVFNKNLINQNQIYGNQYFAFEDVFCKLKPFYFLLARLLKFKLYCYASP